MDSFFAKSSPANVSVDLIGFLQAFQRGRMRRAGAFTSKFTVPCSGARGLERMPQPSEFGTLG
jgi:hypothetical protein